jgi:DNA uptake protein ComE-like DNA-binding protein
MSGRSVLVAVVALGLGVASTAVTAQEVAKRTAKRAAKEATESAAKQKAEEVAKKAAKKAMAPDAVDLNTATPEQLAKLGLDEATAGKIVAARPFTSIEDPKIKEAIPADALATLQGKITVKPADPASAPPATPAATQPTAPPNPE